MKVSVRIRFFLFLLVCLAAGYQSHATHLRAGEITVKRINCSRTFEITITVYTNTKNTPVKFGGDVDLSYLHFGDGQSVYVPEIPNVIRYDLDPEGSIATASFTYRHTYSSLRSYKIRYQEPNRNGGVLNMDHSITTLFYIETVINLDPYLDSQGGCSNSPQLLVPPIDRACTGAAWSHNPGAYDIDGDSLSYEMVIPNSDENQNVVNYREPNDPDFYSNYQTANEDGDSTPTFSIDPIFGTITWDAPGAAGEYNIAFTISEWRKLNGEWFPMGFVRRDMQIIVEECENKRPTLEVTEEICVTAGTNIRINVLGSDPDAHDDSVKVEAFSEIFNFAAAESPARMVYSNPNPLVPKYERKPTTNVFFEWNTECLHVKDQPYLVVFKVTDDPPPGKGAKLSTFKTLSIRVVGPPPTWTTATLDPVTKSVDLEWDPYTCLNDAEFIQVYRRVDSFDFQPDSCETGMPDYAGYKLIRTLPIKDLNGGAVRKYLDDNNGHGLSPAATYCYRLVAIFRSPRGGESYVSQEICRGPFEVDAPVITNVSVLKTSTTDGKIFVAWRKPVDLDTTFFTPPFTYKIHRGNGFAGPQNPVEIATITNPSTTLSFIDSVGLNTEENVYNYRIDVYPNGGAASQFIDSSKVASSVRLEARSLLKKIELTWAADVPWSNQINSVPHEHLIYRGPEGASEADLVLIATVDVKETGFTYVDGEDTPLEDNQIYSYRVMTRGSYGNDSFIPPPLINFSQIIRAQPGDSTAPCIPIAPVAIDKWNCQDYVSQVESCGRTEFSNKIEWNRPDDPLCRNDIAYYNIYAASSTTGEFLLIKTKERTTSYIDENLPSFARCYKISAVDRSGNESDLSEAICFDNCPYYELPNIFSPNTSDDCNDRFSAYGDKERYRKNPNSPDGVPREYYCGGISPEDEPRCARFVERVVFHVYNRWGKEVYSYIGASNDDVNTIYIDWDGRAEDGTDLASGIYYYVADVTFDSVDPEQRQKAIKGWVHLVR